MNLKKYVSLLETKTYKLFKEASQKMKRGISSKINVEDVLADIEKNHNHSWYREVYEKNKDNLDDIAIIYKDVKITYGQLFDNIKIYAKSLKSLGLGVGSEIPICLSNCPEIVYIMGAASMISAKINVFGEKYPSDYVSEIINWSDSSIVFVEDNHYAQLKDGIDKSSAKKVVLISLVDSLKNGKNSYINYEVFPERFNSKVDYYKVLSDKVITQDEFRKIGKDYQDKLEEETDINNEFVITYTSGSTNESRPKAIVHTNRSFITVGRFHNKDLNGGFSLKPLRFLAIIPTYSNSNLVSCISDSLIQGAQLVLEPCYDAEQFLRTLILYKTSYVAAPKSFWLKASKRILYDEKYAGANLGDLFLAFAVGEMFEINEEQFINSALKKAKMGVNKTHTPISILKISEAGGDCEHGSIFYSLFREYQRMNPEHIMTHEPAGMITFPFVEVAVLDKNGNRLGPNKLGKLVANSPCTMKGYKNNEEATKKFFVTDSTGKTWADLNVYGYLSKSGKINIRGRIPKEGELVPPFLIAKAILRDTKNVLSCEVVKDDEKNTFVAHVEFKPNLEKNPALVLYEAKKRCYDLFPKLDSDIYFRIRSFEESFPLTGSGKRNVKKLKEEGLTEICVKPQLVNGRYFLTNYQKDLQKDNEQNKVLKKSI